MHFSPPLSTKIRDVFDAEPPVGLSFPQRLEFLFRRLAELSDRWGVARRLVFESTRRSETARRRGGAVLREDAFIKRLTRWIKKNATSPEDLGGKDPEEVAYMTAGLIRARALSLSETTSAPRRATASIWLSRSAFTESAGRAHSPGQ